MVQECSVVQPPHIKSDLQPIGSRTLMHASWKHPPWILTFPSLKDIRDWDSWVKITPAHCCLVHSRWCQDQARWAAWWAWVRGGQTADHLEQVLLSGSWLWMVWSPMLTQPAAHSSTLSTFVVAVLFLRHVRTITLSCCLVVDLGHPVCLLYATLGVDKCLSVFEWPNGSYKTSCNFCTVTKSLSHASTHYCSVVFLFLSFFAVPSSVLTSQTLLLCHSSQHPYLQPHPRLILHHGPTPKGPQEEMSDHWWAAI